MHPGAPTPLFPSFPEAATTVTPDATAVLIAVVKLGMAVSQFGTIKLTIFLPETPLSSKRDCSHMRP